MPWNTIADGQHPSGDELMENFNYRFQKGTKSALVAIAATNPTIPFVAIATDEKTVYIYTGDVTIGETGFVALPGGGGSW